MVCTHLWNNDNISEEVEEHEGKFAVNGCCGGGCYVIRGIEFCPFCGVRIVLW